MKYKFDTLLKEKNLPYEERWAPTTVEQFLALIKKGILKDMDESLCKNIIYNLQYLEYIDYQLSELKLHSVITKMLFKSFIVTSVSIVEAIFYYILKSNNQHKTTTEKLLFSLKSNKKKYGNEEIVFETNIYKIIEPEEEEMTFDSMIKKMEKRKYLDLKHAYFPYLKYFKDLRNRVHIHITEGDKFGTDFWKFEESDYLFVKYMLLHLLTDDNIIKLETDPVYNEKIIPKEYEFLVLSKKEKKKVLDSLKK